MLKELLLSLFGLTILACSSQSQVKKEVDRCDDCIYLEDYRDYELAKGSKELKSNKEMLFENVFQWKLPEGKVSMTSNSLKCFMRTEATNDKLNVIVCYEVEKVNDINYSFSDDLVKYEYYKIFFKEGHLDNEEITYPHKNGDYASLKKYYKDLTNHLPNSTKTTPKNIEYGSDSKIKNDIKTFIDAKNQIKTKKAKLKTQLFKNVPKEGLEPSHYC